jgi:hypothetical protein
MEYGTTAHNRSVCASPPVGGSGYAKMQSGLRPLCIFAPPHFCGCWNASRSFIATAKTSHTAGTLCDKTKIYIRDNISSIYEIKEKKDKGFKSGFLLLYSFRACVRQAHQPNKGWLLFAFNKLKRHDSSKNICVEECAFGAVGIIIWLNVVKIWRNGAFRKKSIAKSRLIMVI